MKKVYDLRTLVSFNTKDWYDTSYRHHLIYCPEEEAKDDVYEIGTFEKALAFVRFIYNATIKRTWLRKNQVIELILTELLHKKQIKKKGFKPFYIKYQFVEQKNCSFNFLNEQLCGDDFCEWLKDRGMKIYIDNKR